MRFFFKREYIEIQIIISSRPRSLTIWPPSNIFNPDSVCSNYILKYQNPCPKFRFCKPRISDINRSLKPMIKQVLLFACLKVMRKNWSGYKGICFTTNRGFAPFIKNSASNHRIFSRECPASQLNYFHISGLR